MKESILRAAAIASLALALIMSVTTWIGVGTSSTRGSFLIGFFEFALILFLGAVAWALLNALADVVTVRGSVEMLTVRLAKIEAALGIAAASAAEPAADAATSRPAPRAAAEPAPRAEPAPALGVAARQPDQADQAAPATPEAATPEAASGSDEEQPR